MAIITWDESMSVGVAVLDSQHMKIAEIINQLHEAMLKESEKEVLGGIFSELVTYTVYHFGAEEKFFQEYYYPEAQSHILEHTQLTQKATELKAGFESDKMLISVETMYFLKDWLNHHIMETDKKYGPFLNARGVK